MLENCGGWGDNLADEVRVRRRARTQLLVRRSMLFVPVNVSAFVHKAHTRHADAVVLDLEDGVAPSAKTQARTLLREAIAQVGRGGADVLVRINKPFDQAIGDLDAAIVPGLDGIIFPKAETVREIAILDALILQREAAAVIRLHSVGVTVAIESAAASFNMLSILQASEHIVGAVYGAEDVTEELGVETSAGGEERFFGNAQLILAANAAGVQPLGRPGDPFDFRDVVQYERTALRGFQLGFKGASCIHPGQVGPLNRAYTPPSDLIARARETVEIMQAAQRAGRGSASQDGRMVDIPSLHRAERFLERIAAIEAKDARKAMMASQASS
ncbi:MAG: CoA ester lyase [Vulcanimicrobiaceae bacterium]